MSGAWQPVALVTLGKVNDPADFVGDKQAEDKEQEGNDGTRVSPGHPFLATFELNVEDKRGKTRGKAVKDKHIH